MTFEVILYKAKKLSVHIVSIHINFYKNQFIKVCARKKKAKFTEFRNYVKTEFFVKCKRT